MKYCKHEATIGQVGEKNCFCLDCAKEVPNPDWEEGRKELANAKKHPKSKTNPVAVALRRKKELIKKLTTKK